MNITLKREERNLRGDEGEEKVKKAGRGRGRLIRKEKGRQKLREEVKRGGKH